MITLTDLARKWKQYFYIGYNHETDEWSAGFVHGFISAIHQSNQIKNGKGKTPQDAMRDYISKARGKKIVFGVHEEKHFPDVILL